MAEIKSSKNIASAHVSSIQQANSKFSSVGSMPAYGSQINKPAISMRQMFSRVNTVCTDLSNSFGRSVEKINLMAEEFELWDNKAVKTNG